MIIINGKQCEINPENVKISKYDHDYCAFLKDQIEKSELCDGIEEVSKTTLENIKKILFIYQDMCNIEETILENYDKYEIKKAIINDKEEYIKYNILEKYYNDIVRRINMRKNNDTHNLYDKDSTSSKALEMLIEYKNLIDTMLTKDKDDILLCNEQYLKMIGYEAPQKENVK